MKELQKPVTGRRDELASRLAHELDIIESVGIDDYVGLSPQAPEFRATLLRNVMRCQFMRRISKTNVIDAMQEGSP